jgi:hypothetical protein
MKRHLLSRMVISMAAVLLGLAAASATTVVKVELQGPFAGRWDQGHADETGSR